MDAEAPRRESTLAADGPVVQGELFEASVQPVPEDAGYRGPVVASLVGITYRQLDYWARTELVSPSIRPTAGSGMPRLYSYRDIVTLRIIKRLLDLGVSLQQVRQAVESMRRLGIEDLASSTLLSDGASVYYASSPDDVLDLLNSGHAVIGVALGQIWNQVGADLIQLPSENAPSAEAGPADELAARRNKRRAAR